MITIKTRSILLLTKEFVDNSSQKYCVSLWNFSCNVQSRKEQTMETTRLIILALLVSVFLLMGCKSDQSIVNPPPENNLIANSSFELNSSPSLTGWVANTTDTAYIRFALDAPCGGGYYSVLLKNEWSFPGTISYAIAPPVGTHRYQLSAWGKAIRTGSFPSSGEMAILIRRATLDSLRKSFYFSDSTWTYASLFDTVTTVATDTLLIRLRGNYTQFSSGYVLFDLCKFLKLD